MNITGILSEARISPSADTEAGQSALEKAEERLQHVRIADALELFDVAEQSGGDPDVCSAGRWTCRMLTGDFELAWRESDAITRRGKPDPHRFWDGLPVRGRHVLLRCLHGLGDTIQFVRYAELIRNEARSLTIEAQPKLKLLLQQSQIADEVITWGEPEPDWDQQIEVIELPRLYRTTVESIPARVPYLAVPGPPPICPFDGSRPLRVGLAWIASDYNPERSIPLEQFGAVLALPGISFFALQAAPGIVKLCDECTSFTLTAQALKTLDLVITVDTMMAHLAGALARPVWTLLPYQCDWRWMVERQDSPWYPTMRLFRQPRPGDWDAVIQRVKQELRELVSTKRVPVREG